MRVGNRRDQAVGAFHGHVAVGRQVVGAVDVTGGKTEPGAGGDQFLALGVAADGGQQRGAQAEAREGHGEVHRDAARQPRYPPRHIRPDRHVRRRPADDVPQDRADAEDVDGGAHPPLMPPFGATDNSGVSGAGGSGPVPRRRRGRWCRPGSSPHGRCPRG